MTGGGPAPTLSGDDSAGSLRDDTVVAADTVSGPADGAVSEDLPSPQDEAVTGEGDGEGDGDGDGDGPDHDAGDPQDQDQDQDKVKARGPVRRVAGYVLTALAGVLVFFALVSPDQISHLTPRAFVRVPVEGLLGIVLVLILPARVRRVPVRGLVAVFGGLVLGLLTLLKFLDMGYYEALARPFDPVLDWTLLADAQDYVQRSLGRTGATIVTIIAVVLAVATFVLMALSALRLSRVFARHQTASSRGVAVFGLIWVICALLGVHILPGLPVASKSFAAMGYREAATFQVGLKDQSAFDALASVDAYRDTPGSALLTGLRGKDVVLAFVESYGRVAVEDPVLGPQINAMLDAGTRQLDAAGFASRSGFLTSSTAGGASWLAHSTLLSGLWIDNQQRYRNLVASDRLTLGTAFRRAGWRTIGVAPAVTKNWPEGYFFGYDKIYAAKDLDYHGPHFSYSNMPDQFTIGAFQRDERAKPGHRPVMAELDLLSSHSPWAPLPKLIDWNAIGDGSIFNPQPAAGAQPDVVWRDTNRVRAEYAHSIEYSVSTLISYVQTYGDDNLVLVFVGDHQPAPIIAGEGATHDVPITIVARDPAVLDKISGWGWQPGLRPSPTAPLWRMDTFRDRFLAAYGPSNN